MQKSLILLVVAIVALFSNLQIVNAQQNQELKPSKDIVFTGRLYIGASHGTDDTGRSAFNLRIREGIELWRKQRNFLVLYGSFSIGRDTAGKPWNNRNVTSIGLEFAKIGRNRAMFLNGGYQWEKRKESSASGLFGSINAYQEWQSSEKGISIKPLTQFPGQISGYAGFLSTYERGNLYHGLDIKQGVTVYGSQTIKVIPSFSVGISKDTKSFRWNNYLEYGPEIIIAIPSRAGTVHVGAEYNRKFYFENSTTESSARLYVKLWSGWSHRKVIK